MSTQLDFEMMSLARAHFETVADPTHDFGHAVRVADTALYIARSEPELGADEDVLLAAGLFHDAVVFQKHGPRKGDSALASASLAETALTSIASFPRRKIRAVCSAIETCSYSLGIVSATPEGRILQDADALEAVGAIAVMRTFAYSGLINRPFYDPQDPFAVNRSPNSAHWALDLFKERLLVIHERLHTDTARSLAQDRTTFLHLFLRQLKAELDETK